MLKSDCIRANTEWSGVFVYHRKCNIYHKSWVYCRWSKYLAPHRSDGQVVFSETINFETLSLKTRTLLILKSFHYISSFENVHMYAKLSRSLSSRFGATRKLQDFKRFYIKNEGEGYVRLNFNLTAPCRLANYVKYDYLNSTILEELQYRQFDLKKIRSRKHMV